MKVIRASLTEHAARTLEDFCRVKGVTVGSYLEAMAELMDRVGVDADPAEWIGEAPKVVERAQTIAQDRRRR